MVNHSADKMKKQEIGEPKPETVAKVKQVMLGCGIAITVIGVLGFLLLYAC